MLVALLGAVAFGGACCVGSTSGNPARVGECERAVMGVGLGAEFSTLRWDRERRVRPSSMRDDALTASLSAGLRLDRQWQVGLSAPLRLNHRAVGELDRWGGGAGDVRVQVLWDPLEERPDLLDQPGAPVPILMMGVRVPTGRDWRSAEGSLQEDVTGLVGPGLTASAFLERTLDRVPWRLGFTGELGFSDLGPQPSVALTGALGHYFGTRWTLMGSTSSRMSWASLGGKSVGAWRTSAGAQLIHGAALKWRVALSVRGDLPVPGLGRSAIQHANIGLSTLRIF